MDLDNYQNEAWRTSCESSGSLCYVLGLAGETGEVVELVKKQLCHGKDFPPSRMQEELGDVLWYLAALASTFKMSLSSIAARNLDKLQKRYPHGFKANRDPEVP